jgi:class 3 adenylate cyclase
VHEGPALAVTLNDRLDYFGQTVNVAARVQDLATAHSVFTTEPVVKNSEVQGLLERAPDAAAAQSAAQGNH